jgi:hypothetical protein
MVQRFIDFSDPLETVETYLRKASEPRCYVGQLELEAAALQYRRPIAARTRLYQLQESWNWPVSVPTLPLRACCSLKGCTAPTFNDNDDHDDHDNE